MTPKILERIHDQLDLDSPVQATMWCLCLCSFFSLARKSNLVPSSPHTFDKSKQLCRSDVQVGSNGLLITFRWSKTIQLGQRRIQIPIMAMPNSKLCLHRAYLRMIDMVPGQPADPAFILPCSSKVKPVSYKLFQKFIKSSVEYIGLDPSKFSSRSFRRGGANLAFRANVPSELIKVQGDWASQAYLQYLDFTLDQRLMVSQLMCTAISNMSM